MSFFKSISFLLLITTALSAEFTFKELLYIPWGLDRREVGFSVEESGNYGPNSFSVEHNDIYILDSKKIRIIKYYGARYDKDFLFSHNNAVNFYFLDNKMFLLLTDKVVYKIKNEQSEKIFSTKVSVKKLSSAFWDKRKQEIRYIVNENCLLVPDKINNLSYTEYYGVPYSGDIRIFISKKSHKMFSGKFSNGQEFLFDYPQLESVKYLGRTPAGNLLIFAQGESSIYSVNANRKVLLLTPNGELLAAFKLPRIGHSNIFKEFHVDQNGNLYHMISTQEGIYIIGWFITDEQDALAEEYEYPQKFQRDYHYLDMEYVIPEPDSSAVDSLMLPDSLGIFDIPENNYFNQDFE